MWLNLRGGWSLYWSMPILAWALCDFANTIFSSNIITIFFPFYLRETIHDSKTKDQIAGTFVTYTNALSSFFLMLLSPLYGLWIDRTSRNVRAMRYGHYGHGRVCKSGHRLYGEAIYLALSGLHGPHRLEFAARSGAGRTDRSCPRSLPVRGKITRPSQRLDQHLLFFRELCYNKSK